MARKAAEYVAISTINAQMSGWDVLARGIDKGAVEATGYDQIDVLYPNRTDIYGDTLRKNLMVVSLSKARQIAGRCSLGECDHDHGYDEE